MANQWLIRDLEQMVGGRLGLQGSPASGAVSEGTESRGCTLRCKHREGAGLCDGGKRVALGGLRSVPVWEGSALIHVDGRHLSLS